MGFFDDLNDLVSAIKEPLQDISDTMQQVKDDAVSSFSQLGDDVNDLKEQGSGAAQELKNTISDIVPKKSE